MGKKPPPFKRNSIELGRHGRSWQSVPAEELKPGDVVEGKGLVESVTACSMSVTSVEFWSRETFDYGYGCAVRAFVKPLTDTDE